MVLSDRRGVMKASPVYGEVKLLRCLPKWEEIQAQNLCLPLLKRYSRRMDFVQHALGGGIFTPGTFKKSI